MEKLTGSVGAGPHMRERLDVLSLLPRVEALHRKPLEISVPSMKSFLWKW